MSLNDSSSDDESNTLLGKKTVKANFQFNILYNQTKLCRFNETYKLFE